jgi:RNA-directed DNA polymerase
VKLANETERLAVEEPVEGRGLAKGKTRGQNAGRTQSHNPQAYNALTRIREVARGKKEERFTSLMHHVYDVERLRNSYHATRRDAAAGVDGETWNSYGETLEGNLQDLSERLARGGYRAKPARRAFIPKADGKLRPLGIPALEDKVVQRATVEVLNAIYEEDFLGFSYGFRPKRSAHKALDALAVAIQTRKVNWVLDADIRSFFDTLNHGWLVQFLEHRIGDERVVHLIQKWLKAGVLVEDGRQMRSTMGTVQGGSISPLLANIYLHFVFDLWVQQWRKRESHGEVVAVRFADDFIVGFEHRADAEQFQTELRERFKEFGLELHPEKTRLLAFGRKAEREWRDGTGSKPGTFAFLGFTHICARSRKGHFMVRRQTAKARMRRKLQEVGEKLRKRMHDSIEEQGRYLRAVVRGHINYFGVPLNSRALSAFRCAVVRLWMQTLRRRSQKARMPAARIAPIVSRWLPVPYICHPYPSLAHVVTTQGKSRMR